MRIAAQQAVTAGQPDLDEHLVHAIVYGLAVYERVWVDGECFAQLVPDPKTRVQSARRVLRNVAGLPASGLPELGSREGKQVVAVDHDLTSCDLEATARVAEQRDADGTLA